MSGLDELKSEHYPLWLCLSFDAPDRRALMADLILFGFTLDRAIAVTKEPLLRQIRLQWWVEIYDTRQARGVPLAERLLGHIDRHDIPIEALMQPWFDACDKETDDALNACLQGWACLLGWGHQPHPACTDIARNIGRMANHLDVKPLEKPSEFKSLSGFFQAAFWLAKRQEHKPDNTQDRLLAFYLFRNILFG